MIGCSTARTLMTRRLHEALPARQGARLRQHLEGCEACRQEFETEAAFEAGLRQRIAEDALASPTLAIDASRIIRALERTAPRRSCGRERRLRLAAGGAALGLAVVSCLSLRPGSFRVAGGPQPHPSSAEPPARQETEKPRIAGVSPERSPGARRPHSGPPRPAHRLASGGPISGQPSAPAAAIAPAISDEQYLDGRDPHAMAAWLTGNPDDPKVLAWLGQFPRVEDDFVRVPLPLFASADRKAPGVGQALQKYEQEAKTVDARLFRKITLSLKGSSLEEFCEAFEKETGVRVRPSRGVADEKVTVFVNGMPARDVMRAVVRLFGYFWSRSGTAGAYRYELFQDLKSQLAEEELRNRDQDAAILAVDTAMQAYLRELDLPIEALRKKAEQATGTEKERLNTLLHGGWGMAKVYRHLSPADLGALLRGESLHFSGAGPDPQRRLPEEWRPMLLETGQQRELDLSTGQTVDVASLPDALPVVSLRLRRTELGQVSLEGSGGVYSPSTQRGGGTPQTLAVGRSPAAAGPENAQANRELKKQAPFTAEVTLRPEPRCANLKRWYPFGTAFGSGTPNAGAMETPKPHVDSAEVWEEVHRRTGLPIVADCYTRQYDLRSVTVERQPLFDALCRVGDRMGVRWRKDGSIILGRSTSYFWDKLKEVPNRQLRRWQADAREGKGLPLRDLLEIAALSDQQLNSVVTAPGMRQCYGIEEWDIIGGDEARPLRPYARFLAQLLPPQLNEALTPAGLPLSRLTPPQLQEWLRLQPASTVEARLQVEYVPAGAYLWVPVAPRAQALQLVDLRVVSGSTPEAVLAQARQLYSGATERQIRRSTGVLALRLTTAERELFRLGKPPVLQID